MIDQSDTLENMFYLSARVIHVMKALACIGLQRVSIEHTVFIRIKFNRLIVEGARAVFLLDCDFRKVRSILPGSYDYQLRVR